MHLSKEILHNKFSALKKVHFIGIAAPFHSFVASALIARGVTVTASDANQESDSAKQWLKKGILFPGGHDKKYITHDLDLVVFPNGPVPGNPEVAETLNSDRPYVLIQELLGILSKQYKTIAITGTHGKTTTTAMIVWLIHQTLGTPNFIVGDAKDKIGILESNWESHPESPYLVLEACEYKKQFLDRAPEPYISVITHIDLDHTDYFKTQQDYNSAFAEFLKPTTEAIIINAQGVNESEVLKQITACKATVLDVAAIKKDIGTLNLSQKGLHNQENAVRAYAVGRLLGIKDLDIRHALETFPGISTRFEYKGTTPKGSLVYRDFAHNPQKITACLEGARETYPNHHLVAIYQPHNFQRTAAFKDDLVKALAGADAVIIPNIYSVRETDEEKSLITPKAFVSLIQKAYPEKKIIFTDDTPPYEKTKNELTPLESSQSLFLLMSAGDLDKLVATLLNG